MLKINEVIEYLYTLLALLEGRLCTKVGVFWFQSRIDLQAHLPSFFYLSFVRKTEEKQKCYVQLHFSNIIYTTSKQETT